MRSAGNAAGEAFALLTKELSAATASGDLDELNLVMRKLERSSSSKRRLVPTKPSAITTRPVAPPATTSHQGTAMSCAPRARHWKTLNNTPPTDLHQVNALRGSIPTAACENVLSINAASSRIAFWQPMATAATTSGGPNELDRVMRKLEHSTEGK